ncbi:hypothetical protein [Vibrio cincinnatiensis]|uniref:hypothetical protein n=1 Tax=Vibrio cincinnatiensis TaxID=675 RepID=UPI001EDDC233|nr:hypothetical protein [Vibrio cincinnatiensis]MCG3731872.1 hypothetical protein [Vibrio cincinnatiensis]MCG3739266.1 hypothetical protein [Vibrio cincinnatiensis]MCG3745129.1 hypothetical protein [Vibrio cincinnatiensis]
MESEPLWYSFVVVFFGLLAVLMWLLGVFLVTPSIDRKLRATGEDEVSQVVKWPFRTLVYLYNIGMPMGMLNSPGIVLCFNCDRQQEVATPLQRWICRIYVLSVVLMMLMMLLANLVW